MSIPTIAILGAGPAGLGAAWQLARQRKANVVVLEQRDHVGGNAGSFELAGVSVDFGSHRLHPSTAPRIMSDIRSLLGDDLLERPRHGRIRLRGKWIHFPLKGLDLMTNLPWSFRLGVMSDAIRKAIPVHANGHAESFATVLRKGLGSTICNDFYFPYARKIWGLEPDQLSPIQAKKRVSAGSLTKMVKKTLGIRGKNEPSRKTFFYPRHGFGQISRALADAAQQSGADVRLGTSIKKVHLGAPHRLVTESNGQTREFTADHVWSTIPVAALAKIADPAAPAEVRAAAEKLESRAMILIYLVLGQRQFTEYDAHYFPETHIRLTRLSEPKNYSDRAEPAGQTVLCGELPCKVGDDLWQMSDEQLGGLVQQSLADSGIPITAPVLQVTTRRLPHAYPIYRTGYEEHFAVLDGWAEQLDRVLTFGRQGLFAHDNTHHALAMAYAAVDCLIPEGLDAQRWGEHRQEFEKHVVED
jgi:protoporphyrinogen oxidase